ncbi:MAG: arsenate reductase ArsC [Prolixibacteraceae bacterium]
MKILIFCTEGNSCRSQMAEAFLQNLDRSLEVYSASLHPDKSLDKLAVQVMNEIGIDIEQKNPKSFENFEGMYFDYLITLCSGSKEKSNLIEIPARHKIHLGIEDPRKAYCADKQLIYLYRDIRDEIKEELEYFYNSILLPELLDAH